MTNDPYQLKGQPRRRRSERHGNVPAARPPEMKAAYQPDETAPLPLGSETRVVPVAPQPLPPPRQAPVNYDYDRFSGTASNRYVEDEEYDDDDAPRLWPKLLALALGLLLILSAGLYFLVPVNTDGILGTVRGGLETVVEGAKGLLGLAEEKKPTLIKFETPDAVGEIGVRTVFTFTADMPVDSVRMVDEVGSEVIGQLAKIDPQGTVWTVSVVFDEPFNGTFRGDLLVGDTWYQGDKLIQFMTAAATPIPSIEPVLTPEPMAEPSFQPSFEPFTEPAAEVTEAPLAIAAADPFAQTEIAGDPDDGWFIADDPVETFTDDGLGLEEPADEPAVETAASSEPFVVARTTPQAQPTAEPSAAPQLAEATGEPILLTDLIAGNSEWDEPAQTAGAADDLAGDAAAQSEWDEIPPEAQQTSDAAQTSADTASASMPMLSMEPDESALPSVLKIKDDVYEKAKRVTELERGLSLDMPGPGSYVSYEGGVFTFRGDAFRGNAAFGTADMPLQQMSILWKAPLGSLRTDEGTLWGLGWTGQPAIVKWSVELRQMMNIAEAKKDVKALKEVIVGGQDGKVYFFDLNDGVATREPIDIKYPLKGSVSLDTQGRPMLAVGQGISKMPGGKTGPIGLHVYGLIEQQELMFLNGRKTKQQTQYSTNGAFDGTALFDRNTDTMIVSGENGLLYTVALNTAFDYIDTHTIKVNPAIIYQKSKAGGQNDMSVSNEASVAMYGKYVYTADRQGIIKAVDTDSMKTQWAFDAGDNTDATPALGFDEDGSLGLYTGTTVFSRTRKTGIAYIRRLDAMSGREVWKKEVPASYSDDERAGVKASPVVGENRLSDLVIFTVNRTNDGKDATVYALNKQTGEEVWSFMLNSPTVSSPVAVYTSGGDGYIVQADEKGVLYLLNGLTGEQLHTLELGSAVDASPAVYNDVLVIGSSEKDNSYLYGIRLE